MEFVGRGRMVWRGDGGSEVMGNEEGDIGRVIEGMEERGDRGMSEGGVRDKRNGGK